jgi:ABC-type sugar transport system ATPase subunit
MTGMAVAFPGTQALDGVDLVVDHGEIRALLGENGAGKSTLMKVLAGAEEADEGVIELDGQVLDPRSPRDARAAGVAMVFQEMSLAYNLSVAENITLGNYPSRGGVMRWTEVRRIAAEALAQLHVDLPLDARVSELTIAQQQMVEIAKAVVTDLKILILDEPTSALTETETLELFDLMQRLSERGIAVMYISHNLEEIFAVCHSVTVMRDGTVIDTHRVMETDVDELISQMADHRARRDPPRGPRPRCGPQDRASVVRGAPR